MSYKMQSKL